MSKVVLYRLLIAALLLPTAVVVLLVVGQLLTGLGDSTGGRVLYRTALAGGVAWVLVLLTMLYAVAAKQLGIGQSSACCEPEDEAFDEELEERLKN